MESGLYAFLTEDCTMEHRMRRIERPAVDSGTQAGIHVPVCVFVNITAVFLCHSVW